MRNPFALYPVSPDLPRLTVEHVPGKYVWIVQKPFKLGEADIPEGFEFDGASVPRILWWFVRPAGVAFESAAAHDYHYRMQDVSRETADQWLYDNCMTYSGGRWIRSSLVWASVRLFGGGIWRRHARSKVLTSPKDEE